MSIISNLPGGSALGNLLSNLDVGKPGLPNLLQPPGLNLPDDLEDPSRRDHLPNPNGNPHAPGRDPSAPAPGQGPGGPPVGTADPAPQPNAPLLNPDNPASRLLQGQSPGAGNAAGSAYNNPFNSSAATQYPPPTLSERALANATQFAMADRPAVNYAVMPAAGNAQGAVVQGQGLPQTASGALPPGLAGGTGAGAAATPATATAAASQAAPGLALVNTATPNAVPASPMAAALSQDALAAQQSVLARMAGTHAPVAGNTVANAAPPPSETSATLPAIGNNAAHNDPRALPLGGHERAAQQRGDAPHTLVYTGDAAPRARRRGGRVGNATLSQWLWHFGRGGVHRPSHEAEPELEALRALQWLFWVLTVVAYVCLAMAVVLMLPNGSLVSERASPGGSGFALFLGVAVAVGAWWLGRRINRSR